MKKFYKFKNSTVEVSWKSELSLNQYQLLTKSIEQTKKGLADHPRDSEEWGMLCTDIRRLKKQRTLNVKYNKIRFHVTLTNWSKFSKWYEREFDLSSPNFNSEIRRYVLQYKLQTVRLFRDDQKNRGSSKLVGEVTVKTSGGKVPVYTEDKSILKAHIQKNIKTLFADKRPETTHNYLGIEIEFCSKIKEEELALKLFQAGLSKTVQLKKDGSLRPHEGEQGFEFAILLKENNYKKELKKICDLIQSVKGYAVDRRCGLHVHFDMRKRDKTLVYNNLVCCQEVLWSLVDPNRYNTEFCRNVSSKKFPVKFENTRQERYKSINAAAYYRHKTLEVRMHEGSVSFKDITQWIDILIKIVHYKKKMILRVPDMQTLNRRVRLPRKVFLTALDKSCYWQVNRAPNATFDHIREILNIGNPFDPPPTRSTVSEVSSPLLEDSITITNSTDIVNRR